MPETLFLCVSLHTNLSGSSANEKRRYDSLRISVTAPRGIAVSRPQLGHFAQLTLEIPALEIHLNQTAEKIEVKASHLAQVFFKLYREFLRLDKVSLTALEQTVIRSSSNAEPSQRVPAWLEKARDIVHARFDEQPKLYEIAASVGVHPVHLARQFRKYYGSSVGQYLRRIRIEFACHLLLASDDAPAKIATAAGFNDQSHFSRTFKRLQGTTPGKYRSALKYIGPSGASKVLPALHGRSLPAESALGSNPLSLMR